MIHKREKSYLVIAIFAFVFLFLIGSGVLFYKHQFQNIKEERKKDLTVTNHFKMLHLNIWVEERIQFGYSVLNDRTALKTFHTLVNSTESKKISGSNEDLFRYYTDYFGYKNTILFNNELKLIYSANPTESFYKNKVKEIINQKTSKDSVSLSHLYKYEDNSIRIALVIPLKAEEKNFGWLLLVINPEEELKQFIKLSPSNLNTFSTILIFKDDCVALYPSASGEFFLKEMCSLSSKAVIINNGYLEGKDNNGNEVIAYVENVPGTSFFLMSKINNDEIKQLAYPYLQGVIIVLIMLFSISALIIVFVWKSNKAKFYKKEYEFQKEKNILLKQYEYLSKYANDSIILINEAGIIIQTNEKTMELYGYSKDELWGKSGKILRPPELQNKYDEVIKLTQSKHSTLYETIHQKKNGEKIFVEISTRTFIIKGYKYTQAIIRDITERKSADEKIRQHSMFLDSVGQAVVACNFDSEIIYWNKAAEKLFGWERSDVIGKNVLSVISIEMEKNKISEIFKVLKNGNCWSGEVKVKKKDGSELFIKTTDSPIYNSEGEAVGIVAVLDDLSEQKLWEKEILHAKEKAEELNKVKSNFLANMSHEIRTPLIGILGYSEMILDEAHSNELKEKIRVIYKSGKKLNETLNSILDITKIESEKVEVNYERFNLGETITESVILYKVLANEKGVDLKYSPGTNGLMVLLDKNMLTKILNNLLSNAVKYTNEGEIIVSTYCINGKIRIDVNDTGIGIPEDKINIVFEPFRQVSEGYNRRFEGTGLGLTITKMLVKKMGGEIYLESKQGKGSRFSVEFPLYADTKETENINSIILYG